MILPAYFSRAVLCGPAGTIGYWQADHGRQVGTILDEQQINRRPGDLLSRWTMVEQDRSSLSKR